MSDSLSLRPMYVNSDHQARGSLSGSRSVVRTSAMRGAATSTHRVVKSNSRYERGTPSDRVVRAESRVYRTSSIARVADRFDHRLRNCGSDLVVHNIPLQPSDAPRATAEGSFPEYLYRSTKYKVPSTCDGDSESATRLLVGFDGFEIKERVEMRVHGSSSESLVIHGKWQDAVKGDGIFVIEFFPGDAGFTVQRNVRTQFPSQPTAMYVASTRVRPEIVKQLKSGMHDLFTKDSLISLGCPHRTIAIWGQLDEYLHEDLIMSIDEGCFQGRDGHFVPHTGNFGVRFSHSTRHL